MIITDTINSIDALIASKLSPNENRINACSLVERIYGNNGFELGKRIDQKKDDLERIVPDDKWDFMWFHRMDFVRNLQRTRNYGRKHMLTDNEYHNVCVMIAKATKTTTEAIHGIVSSSIANTSKCTLNNASLDSLSVSRQELNLANIKISSDLIIISVNYYITIIGDECIEC